MDVYVALLRGINVGGKNLIKMADLAASFKTMGMQKVQTYIQSGNVIFSTDARDRALLESAIEAALGQVFHYSARLVLRSLEEMHAVVTNAPDGFGSEPDTYRYDCIFLKDTVSASEVMAQVTPREGVDRAYEGLGVMYFSRLISRASHSRLTRIISLPVYPSVTIRNWNTTTRLLAMMEQTASR